MSASDYSQIVDAVERLIAAPAKVNDHTVRAYMIARAAILFVMHTRDAEKASELAYKIADEIATQRGTDGVRL